MAKRKATKLPKRIVGVKLSKRMRKRGGKLLDLVRHPLAAEIATAALVAAVAVIKDDERVRAAAAKTRDKAGAAASGLGQGVANLGASVAARASRAYQEAADGGEGRGKPKH